MPTRRDFLRDSTALAAVAGSIGAPAAAAASLAGAGLPEGATPALQDVTANAIAEAEKLAGITFTDAERATIAQTISEQRALLSRRLARGFIPNDLAPAGIFRARSMPDPAPPVTIDGDADTNLPDPGPLPARDADLAFAPVWKLAGWLDRGDVTSERLTKLALARLERHSDTLFCTITLMPELALDAARRADAERKAGQRRGPLHGVPWGAKDIIDTAGVRTTWGAEPWRDRVAERDASVVDRLDDAGAVLVAKLAVGALAYGDIWFGGTCRNPWNVEQGSSGSSAGSASAVAAGLVPFALGTETYGSIVSPCMRCGTTGLRPTFGRVARTGTMALCWSLDKIGPITRSVHDTMLVLRAINGADPGDPSSVDEPCVGDPLEDASDLRIGFDPRWFRSGPDRAALDAARGAGFELVEIEWPQIDASPVLVSLYAEGAAAFEEMTRSNADDRLTWQEPQAWPNTFRRTWFIPAIELIQAERWRRVIAMQVDRAIGEVDAVFSPSFAGGLLLATNGSGHPTLVLRSGFADDRTPHGVTLTGRLFDEGTLVRAGVALERAFGVSDVRPPAFA